jgi:hypothetical protein
MDNFMENSAFDMLAIASSKFAGGLLGSSL